MVYEETNDTFAQAMRLPYPRSMLETLALGRQNVKEIGTEYVVRRRHANHIFLSQKERTAPCESLISTRITLRKTEDTFGLQYVRRF